MNDIEQQSDNTRVAMSLQRMPVIPYDYMAEALRIREATPEFKQDNRTESQKKYDHMVSDYLIYEDQKQKNLQEAAKAVDAMLTMVSPSTYVGAATRDNDKSYWENVASGEGFGNFWGNFLLDSAVAGLAVKGAAKGASKQVTKQIDEELIDDIQNRVFGYVSYPNGPKNVKVHITDESAQEAKKLLGDNAEYVDFKEKNALGLRVPTELSQRTKDYYKMLEERFKAFGIKLPDDFDISNVPVYKIYAPEFADDTGNILIHNYTDEAKGVNDFYGWKGFHTNSPDEIYIRERTQNKTPKNFNRRNTELHEALHVTDKYIPDEIKKIYKEMSGFSDDVEWNERRETKHQVDLVMKEKYGNSYSRHLNPDIKEEYKQELVDDFVNTMHNMNGYGKSWIYSKKSWEDMRKVLPLPILTLPLLQQQNDE